MQCAEALLTPDKAITGYAHRVFYPVNMASTIWFRMSKLPEFQYYEMEVKGQRWYNNTYIW